MNFAAIYSFIGLVFLMPVIAFGNLIDKFKENGLGIGWVIFGCIMVIVAWPYFAYIAIKEI